MRIIFKIFVILFFLTPLRAFPQEIKKSTTIEFIGGVNYYLHTVESGQTLYGIAKAYEVTEEEITRANPDLKKDLKAGQVLKIPVKPGTSANPVIHTVKQGETLSQIAVNYKVKLDDIIRANPGIDPNSIRPGQQLKIPAAGNITESVGKGGYTLHIVQKYETLFGIARKYGVSVDDLKMSNPGLNETIQIGQQIRVPLTGTEIKTPDKPKDTITFECMRTGLLPSYNIGLLIPLYLERAGYIDTSDSDKSVKKYSSFTFLGFYEGFMIALDSMKQLGLSVKLMVDDVVEDTTKITSILQKESYSDLNLLIGPFFSKVFTQASDWSKEHKVKVVNPFTYRSDFVKDNPYIFKNVASNERQATLAADYIRKTWPGCNIFLVHCEKESDKEMVDAYRNALRGTDSSATDFFEVIYTKDGFTGISRNMDPSKVNVVISFIHGEAGISNYIRNMSDYSYKYPLVVFGLREWEVFSSLEAEYLLNINLHIISHAFIDYNKQAVKDFVITYRLKYHSEPDEYAFAGYDIGMYYLNALRLYGKDFQNCLKDYKQELLATRLDFEQKPGQGWENTNICIYRYYDFRLIDALTDPMVTVEINKKN